MVHFRGSQTFPSVSYLVSDKHSSAKLEAFVRNDPEMTPTILVTGGAGFIGSNFVLSQLYSGTTVVNLDRLTYAGNLANLGVARDNPQHIFIKGSINDPLLVDSLLARFRPSAIVHFAAESHVDRSIHSPSIFLETNVSGTFTLLEAALRYWQGIEPQRRKEFRFLHVSTDEVYGSLQKNDPPFTESSPYRPNSPYAASKAASDHLVRAYHHTYGLPTLITNCSNNYGPCQFPEKMIPLMMLNALRAQPLPVYGDGRQIRDWLHVTDHCLALKEILMKGRLGETYNVGGGNELTNLEVVKKICSLVDEVVHRSSSAGDLIRFVPDRPGHDFRYAIDFSKLRNEMGWTPKRSFDEGLRQTFHWYLQNDEWAKLVDGEEYRRWIDLNYTLSDESCEA
jgi:dTDP-glucose 4,6-dehydratase